MSDKYTTAELRTLDELHGPVASSAFASLLKQAGIRVQYEKRTPLNAHVRNV